MSNTNQDNKTKVNLQQKLDPDLVFLKYRKLKKHLPFLDYNYLKGTFHKKNKGRISHAFGGQAPQLLVKIDNHLDLLKNKYNINFN